MSPEFRATSAKPYKGRTVDFDAGDFVFREGDLGTEMFIIHEGQIEDAPEEVVQVNENYIRGVGKLDDRMIILLELEKILQNS